MNRVLILTFQRVDNHGAILQNFALQTAVRDLGFQAECLNYHCEGSKTGYPDYFWPRNVNRVGEFLTKLARHTRNGIRQLSRKTAFQRFRGTYLTLTREITIQELSTVDGRYDVYIAGSDQVWNVEIIQEDHVDVYTLQFVHNGKRAAYAASAGSRGSVTPALVRRISTLDLISVREHSLKERLEQGGLTGVRDVCDPVFLLERARWEHLLPIADPHERPYVFVYYVNSEDVCRLSKDIAAERGLEIRHVNRPRTLTKGFGVSRYEAGPVGFISYIAHAEATVLSSFHGLAFSILFEKEFFLIHPPSWADRTRDLLDLLDLSDRGFDSYEDYCLRKDSVRPVDWRAVREKLAQIRETSRGVLLDICNLS